MGQSVGRFWLGVVGDGDRSGPGIPGQPCHTAFERKDGSHETGKFGCAFATIAGLLLLVGLRAGCLRRC